MSRPSIPFLPQVVRDQQIHEARHHIDIARVNLFLAKQRMQQEQAQRLNNPQGASSAFIFALVHRRNMATMEREVEFWKTEIEALKESEEVEKRRRESRGLWVDGGAGWRNRKA